AKAVPVIVSLPPRIKAAKSSVLIFIIFTAFPVKLIQPVQGRQLVGFRQSRVVKQRIAKVFHRGAKAKHCLPDVNNLGGILPYNVHPPALVSVPASKSIFSSPMPSPRSDLLPAPRTWRFQPRKDLSVGELGLRLTRHRDLWNCVNPRTEAAPSYSYRQHLA